MILVRADPQIRRAFTASLALGHRPADGETTRLPEAPTWKLWGFGLMSR